MRPIPHLIVLCTLTGCIAAPPETSPPDAATPDAGVPVSADVEFPDGAGGDAAQDAADKDADASVEPIPDADDTDVSVDVDASGPCSSLPVPYLHWSFDALDAEGVAFVSTGAAAIRIAAAGATALPDAHIDGVLQKTARNHPYTDHDAALELKTGTITFWFNVAEFGAVPTDGLEVAYGLLSKDEEGTVDNHFDIRIVDITSPTSAGRLYVRLQNPSADKSLELKTPPLVVPGRWHMATLRWNGEQVSLSLDANASSFGEYAFSLASNFARMAVGFSLTHYDSTPESGEVGEDYRAQTAGMFDELIFWDQELTDDQIRELYDGQCSFNP